MCKTNSKKIGALISICSVVMAGLSILYVNQKLKEIDNLDYNETMANPK